MSFLLVFLAGVFEGYMDVLQFHWSKFFDKHRKRVNVWFWNPKLSWENKYKDRDPSKGEAFFGSTTFFVSLTDGWHLMKLFRNVCLFGSMYFLMDIKYFHIYAAIGMYGINRIGFNLIYKIIYK